MNDSAKKIGSISLDLDNQWSYMKIHGDEGWKGYPSYLNIFIPKVLEVLKSLDLKITFFVVGQDAALSKNSEYLKMITDNGHEVGNHSFKHESWLHLYSQKEIEEEISKAEEAICSACGEKPIGFRGPGFSWSQDLLNVLHQKNYLFDASTLPTYIGPLARMYYFWTSDLTKEEKKQRKALFGTFKDGLRPVKPYYWRLEADKKILEIPVSTVPLIKTPFHLSYLLYISRFSPLLMKAYLQNAILFCKITNTKPSILLHPLDIISGDYIKELKFFPGMDIPTEKKINTFTEIINQFKKYFELVNMSTHARSIISEGSLSIREITN